MLLKYCLIHQNITTLGQFLSLVYGESGLLGYTENQKDHGSTPLGARPGFGRQPRYEAPGDVLVESKIKGNASGLKVAVGLPSSSFFKKKTLNLHHGDSGLNVLQIQKSL